MSRSTVFMQVRPRVYNSQKIPANAASALYGASMAESLVLKYAHNEDYYG